jgi:hypothetical protein
MPLRLFNRTAAVTIVHPTNLKNEWFSALGNGVTIKDHQIKFKIERDLQKEPNKCEISITNLSERSRAEFQRLPLIVRIDAGYDGINSRLFTGDLRYAVSSRESTDWITKLQLADGDRAYKFARVARGFNPGVTYGTLVAETAKALGLDLPDPIKLAPEMQEQLVSGCTLSGPAQQEMTRLLAAKGMTWSIQQGILQILRSADVRADQAIVISQDTGMIGSPEFGAPPKAGKPPHLKVKTALEPRIRPGGRVVVQARAIHGTFRADKVVHSGDTRGNEWVTEIECTPL